LFLAYLVPGLVRFASGLLAPAVAIYSTIRLRDLMLTILRALVPQHAASGGCLPRYLELMS
jgi:hypothetical protein